MAISWKPGLGVYLAQQAPPPSAQKPKQVGPVFQLEPPAPTTLQKFEGSIKEFQESLTQLSSVHKAEIRTIHEAVKVWAEQASGKKVDRLSTFVGRVCEYCNGQLESIEKTDPDLLRRREEHKQLNDVFYRGAALIDAYHAYVKDKTLP